MKLSKTDIFNTLTEMINWGAFQVLPSFQAIRHSISAWGYDAGLTQKFLDVPGIDPDELECGVRQEMKAAGDLSLAKKIAITNIKKDPHYYSSLKKYQVEELHEQKLQAEDTIIDFITSLTLNPKDLFDKMNTEKSAGLSPRDAGLAAIKSISNDQNFVHSKGENENGESLVFGDYLPIDSSLNTDSDSIGVMSEANQSDNSIPFGMIQTWKFLQSSDDRLISNFNSMLQKGNYKDAWELVKNTIEMEDKNDDYTKVHNNTEKFERDTTKPKNHLVQPSEPSKDKMVKLAENALKGNYGGWMDKSGKLVGLIKQPHHHEDTARQIVKSLGIEETKPANSILLDIGYAHVVNDENGITLTSDHPLTTSQKREAKNIGIELGVPVINSNFFSANKIVQLYNPANKLEENKTIHGIPRSAPSNIDPTELAMGMTIEMERHTDNDHVAEELAVDNLKKDPHYYSKLQKAGLTDACYHVLSSGIGDPSTPINQDYEIGHDASPGPGNIDGKMGVTPTMKTIGKHDSAKEEKKQRKGAFQLNSNIAPLMEDSKSLRLKHALELMTIKKPNTTYNITKDLTKTDPKMVGNWKRNAFNHQPLPSMKPISPRPSRKLTLHENNYLLNTPEYGEAIDELRKALKRGITDQEGLENIALGYIKDPDQAIKLVTSFREQFGLEDDIMEWNINEHGFSVSNGKGGFTDPAKFNKNGVNEDDEIKDSPKKSQHKLSETGLTSLKSKGSFSANENITTSSAKMVGKWTTNSFNNSKVLNENYDVLKKMLDEAVMDKNIHKKAYAVCESIKEIINHLNEKCKGKCDENPALSGSLTMEDENGNPPLVQQKPGSADFLTNESVVKLEGRGKVKVGNIKETLGRKLNTIHELLECGDYKQLTAHTTNGQLSVLDEIKKALKISGVNKTSLEEVIKNTTGNRKSDYKSFFC